MFAALVIAASMVSPVEAGPNVLGCQSCLVSTEALIKQVPILSRTNTREGDKELALGDALPMMCSSYVFSGLDKSSELADACKPFSKTGSAIEAGLLAGKKPGEVCEALCAGVAEGDRVPKPKAAAPKKDASKEAKATGGKPLPRKGSVDDPAFAAALKAKAARDKARAKRNAKEARDAKKKGKGGEDDEDAGREEEEHGEADL